MSFFTLKWSHFHQNSIHFYSFDKTFLNHYAVELLQKLNQFLGLLFTLLCIENNYKNLHRGLFLVKHYVHETYCIFLLKNKFENVKQHFKSWYIKKKYKQFSNKFWYHKAYLNQDYWWLNFLIWFTFLYCQRDVSDLNRDDGWNNFVQLGVNVGS